MNAKDEFLKEIQGKEILCVDVQYGDDWSNLDEDETQKIIQLRAGYSDQEYENFLHELNFTYDSGYGGQLLYGFIWYKDGTWSDRGEYDGSEWWVHQVRPSIPIN